jgi:alkanesulfonate monooxygenase SsuD/methylene tetrahydromethanopterin reductase-like flavin-dependent oxidoreductase (luciferase family)
VDGPPLWIAGGGEKKTLRIAAEHAQYTNFDGSLEGFAHKSEVLRGHCEAIGRPFEEITRSANYNVVIGETQADVDDKIAWVEEHYALTVPEKAPTEAENFRNGPLVGTPEQIVGTLRELEKLGMTYAITYFLDAAYDRSSIELFEREVVPALR